MTQCLADTIRLAMLCSLKLTMLISKHLKDRQPLTRTFLIPLPRTRCPSLLKTTTRLSPTAWATRFASLILSTYLKSSDRLERAWDIQVLALTLLFAVELVFFPWSILWPTLQERYFWLAPRLQVSLNINCNSTLQRSAKAVLVSSLLDSFCTLRSNRSLKQLACSCVRVSISSASREVFQLSAW